MRAVKTLKFQYTAPDSLITLMEEFRLMCNDAIRIAVKEKPRNRFALQAMAYPRLKEYGIFAHYIHAACEVAYSVYRNKRRRKNPYVEHSFLKLEASCYSLDHLLLRLPVRAREYVYLVLHPSNYHLSIIDDPSLKRGSITLNARTISIAFSKEIAEVEPRGQIGVDVNERNITWTDTKGRVEQKDTSKVTELKERYKMIRARIARMTKNDRRVQKLLLAKYGKRERVRTVQAIHKITTAFVDDAKESQYGIAMEKLTGIRRLYQRGNGQGASYRGRMNSWAFHEFQRQVEYKAAWLGVPVTFVNPRGTSQNCPDCGSRVAPMAERKLHCLTCDKTWDRDVLASKNIMAAAPGPAARPPIHEAMRERSTDAVGNLTSRKVEAGGQK